VHLLNLAQHRLILIQIVTYTCQLYVSTCTLKILRHVKTVILQRRYNKNLRSALFIDIIFIVCITIRILVVDIAGGKEAEGV